MIDSDDDPEYQAREYYQVRTGVFAVN